MKKETDVGRSRSRSRSQSRFSKPESESESLKFGRLRSPEYNHEINLEIWNLDNDTKGIFNPHTQTRHHLTNSLAASSNVFNVLKQTNVLKTKVIADKHLKHRKFFFCLPFAINY